MDLGRCAQHRR